MSPSIAIPKSSNRKSNKKSNVSRTSSSSLSSSTTSSSYNMPQQPVAPHQAVMAGGSSSSPFSTSSSSSSGMSSSPSTPTTGAGGGAGRVLTAKDKGKGKMMDITPEQIAEQEALRWASSPFRRRPSLMGKELEATKHIVVDVGAPDAPRLISCVASSQGFDWNSSIFLPRYLTGRYADEQLEHRQDPIEDIFVSDEEARNIFPQW